MSLGEKQINIRDVWQVAYRRKWLVILPLILAMGASFGMSLMLTERYQSRVTILIRKSEILGPEIQRITTRTGFDVIRTERELMLWQQSIKSEITSPATLIRVINKLGLADNPKIKAEIEKLSFDYPQYSKKELMDIRLIKELQDQYIYVAFPGQNIVSIMCQSEKPLEARKMAETVANIFREEQIKEDLLRIRAMQEFSTEQLSIYKKEWEDAEEDLADFKKNYARARVGQQVSDDILNGITSEIDQAKLYMEDVIDQRNFVATKLENAGIDTESLTLSETLIGYISTLNGINRQKASLLERYQRTDPKVLEIVGRYSRALDSLETLCINGVNNLQLGLSGLAFDQAVDYLELSIKVDVAVQEQIILNRTLEKLKNRYTSRPDYEIELNRLEQKALTKEDIYKKFNTQLLGSRINEDAFRKEAENRYKIIEPATLPLRPVYPDRLKIIALGCVLGLVLGVGAVLLVEMLDNSLRNIEETEDFLELKVLGTIPKIEVKRGISSRPKSKPVEIIG